MINFYPGDNRRWQFRAFISKEDPRQAETIAYYRERGAADFLQKVAEEMVEEQDDVRGGTVVKLDLVALPVVEFEKLLMNAFDEGRRAEMWSNRPVKEKP